MADEPVRQTIANFLIDIAPLFVPSNSSAPLDDVVDSMGVTELVQFIEEHWKTKVDDSEINRHNLGTVDAITTFVLRKTAARNLS
jgi:acyl carrier protein